MSEEEMPDSNEQDRVDWMIPVSQGVSVEKLNANKLARANEEYGVEVHTRDGKADIYKKVVEGMPAPRKENFWRRLFGKNPESGE